MDRENKMTDIVDKKDLELNTSAPAVELANDAARNSVNQILKDEVVKNFLDDIENLTGGPSIKITPKQYNEVKE